MVIRVTVIIGNNRYFLAQRTSVADNVLEGDIPRVA